MSPVPEEQPVACTTALKPGAKAVFKVLSPAKPGFVRSYYLGPYAEDGTQDMPNDVAVELDTFLHFPSSGKSQLILGPAFAPDTPRNVLANELLKSLESLVEQHQIDSHSRFARKAAGVLIQVAGTTSSTLSPQADGALETLKSSEPNGESEKEVWLAIESDLSNSTVVAQIHSPRSVPTADAMSHLIQRVDPKAPAIGNLAKFGGTVKVHIVISTSGEVASVAAVSGASLFVRAATEAVKQWKFSPFLDGKTPTMVATDIDFDFPAGTSESENAAGKEPK
jgi:TonB family protein